MCSVPYSRVVDVHPDGVPRGILTRQDRYKQLIHGVDDEHTAIQRPTFYLGGA